MSYPVSRWRGRVGGDPFAAIEVFQDRLNQFLSSGFTGYPGRVPSRRPDVDIDEDAGGWTVQVPLPGVAPEEVAIEVIDRELMITSVSPEESEESEESGGDGAGSRSERWWRDFCYRLAVPANVDTKAIDATMDHGLLTVRLPREVTSRSRRIAVGSGGAAQTIEGRTTSEAPV